MTDNPMGQTTLLPAVPVPTEHIEPRWHGRGDPGHMRGCALQRAAAAPENDVPPPTGAAAYLQVTVNSFCSTLVDAQITL